jgi:Phage derived protein Gp49-like (DUF891).
MTIKSSESWRIVFTTEVTGKIVVLHATQKTTNGVDRQLKNVVENRLKSLRDKLKDKRQAVQKNLSNKQKKGSGYYSVTFLRL